MATKKRPALQTPLVVTFAVAIALGLAGGAFAAASLVVTAATNADEAHLELELVTPDGSSLNARDDDGDGTLVLDVPGRGGPHEVTLTLGAQTATSTVTIPSRGQLALVFDPAAEPSIQVAYRGGTEEIFVTARKREENVQQTPVAISAFTAEALEERVTRDLSDVADFTPNLDFATTTVLGGSNNTATVYIRGIGQITEALWADPGVGIYLDGVYIARAQGAVTELVDVERVEVLRGPQGTLFGKNTIGGALSIITKKPDSVFGGHVELETGSRGRLDGSLRVGGALTEELFASFAASSTNADGYTRSLWTGEKYSDDNTDSGRGALRWQASESLTVDLAADATRQRERAAPVSLAGLVQVPLLDFYNTATGLVGLPGYDERWITESPRDSYSSDPNFADSDIGGVSLDVFKLLGDDLSVRSLTAYRDLDLEQSSDFDASPIVFATLPSQTEQSQWSEEVQLSGIAMSDRLSWVAGGLYFEEDVHAASFGDLLVGLFEALESLPGPILAPPGFPNFLCDPGPPPPGLPCFGGAGNPANLIFAEDPDNVTVSDPATVSWAVFGEANFDLSPRLTLTAGLRFTSESKDFLFRELPGPGEPPRVEEFREETWNTVTPRLALAFQAKPEVMFYLSAANGFKSGGFNGLFGDNTDRFLEPFEPERVWAYEAGLKADLWSRRLRINTAVFWNDYRDLQLTASTAVDGEPIFVVQNAGKAEIKGLELELDARLGEHFRLTTGVGYTDAGYTELEDTIQAITLDGTIPRTPEWNVVFSPEWSFLTPGGGSLLVRADYSYKTKTYNDIANTDGVAQPAYGLANARASWILPSGAWELFAYGTNLADKEYREHGVFPEAFGAFLVVSGRPREWGGGAKYRF